MDISKINKRVNNTRDNIKEEVTTLITHSNENIATLEEKAKDIT